MERDQVGLGDSRFDETSHQGGANIPGTPGYEAEAAQRHHEKDLVDMDEVRPNQLAPGPLTEESGGNFHFEIIDRHTPTKHASK